MNNEMCGCGTEEKTSTAKGLVRINYKEDFELVVELLAGDKPYKLGDEDFRIDFIVMASRYTVGRTGGVCERCSVDGNKIRCFMDSHGLPPGELRAEVKVNTPDPNYADGKRLNVAIAEGMVVLVKDNTHFDGAVVKANIPVALIDAYQLAKAHGYKGTIDEYYATFTEIGHLKENIKGTLDEMTKAEKRRADAETERAKAETERQRKQDILNTAEDERVKNEQQRQNSEEKRQQAEVNRFTAENYRASAEVERLNAEQQRNSTEEARKTAESQRAKDELTRVGSENARFKSEDSRIQAEKQRQTDEELRKQAETKRVNAEERRMSSEKERSTTFSSMQENINSKIKDVNAATSDLKSIIGMDKGVFASIDALQTAYPSPQVGYSAKVGTEFPYAIYVCEKAGTWKDSGAKYTPTTQIPTIEQTIGESKTSVMSQKAVTEAIPKIADDLSVDDTTKALSAAQGKKLREMIKHNDGIISMLVDKVDGVPETTKNLNLSAFELTGWWIDANTLWDNKYPTWGNGIIIPLDGVKHIQIKGSTSKGGRKSEYALLKDFDTNKLLPHFAAGTYLRRNFAIDKVAEIDVQDDAAFLYLCVANGAGLSEKVLPSSVVFTYYAQTGFNKRISACEASKVLAVDMTIKKTALLGDSITWLSLSSNPERGWARYFARNMKFAELRNYARSGATWSNSAMTKLDTKSYSASTTPDNVIFNQLQRLFIDLGKGFKPDYIVIVAGINDVWFPDARPDALAKTAGEVMESGQRYSDKDVSACTSIAESIRLVAELLWQRLPDVQVVLLSPMQSTSVEYSKVRQATEIMRGCANYLGWGFISQMDEIPVNRIREKWENRLTYDGTHTSELGARIVGDILSSKIHTLLNGSWSTK